MRERALSGRAVGKARCHVCACRAGIASETHRSGKRSLCAREGASENFFDWTEFERGRRDRPHRESA